MKFSLYNVYKVFERIQILISLYKMRSLASVDPRRWWEPPYFLGSPFRLPVSLSSKAFYSGGFSNWFQFHSLCLTALHNDRQHLKYQKFITLPPLSQVNLKCFRLRNFSYGSFMVSLVKLHFELSLFKNEFPRNNAFWEYLRFDAFRG
jgi:hypothetical protein